MPVKYRLRTVIAVFNNLSQGMTLDAVQVDFKGVFGDSMVYVALSRARTLDGLAIANLNLDDIRTSTAVLNFYDLLHRPQITSLVEDTLAIMPRWLRAMVMDYVAGPTA